MNILACKLARVIGLPTPDGEVAQFHQIKFDIHCSTHKVVLLQLSQATSENWVKLSKLLNFSQIANEDIAHISNTLVDADECCCEVCCLAMHACEHFSANVQLFIVTATVYCL